jgi:anti-anti-sigma regulatory factor
MHTISLPERCDRAAAEALLPEFVAALGSGPLLIDASATRQCGQAMLQLLISARRTGEGARITPSPALIDVAMLCGLDNELFEEEIAGAAA